MCQLKLQCSVTCVSNTFLCFQKSEPECTSASNLVPLEYGQQDGEYISDSELMKTAPVASAVPDNELEAASQITEIASDSCARMLDAAAHEDMGTHGGSWRADERERTAENGSPSSGEMLAPLPPPTAQHKVESFFVKQIVFEFHPRDATENETCLLPSGTDVGTVPSKDLSISISSSLQNQDAGGHNDATMGKAHRGGNENPREVPTASQNAVDILYGGDTVTQTGDLPGNDDTLSDLQIHGTAETVSRCEDSHISCAPDFTSKENNLLLVDHKKEVAMASILGTSMEKESLGETVGVLAVGPERPKSAAKSPRRVRFALLSSSSAEEEYGKGEEQCLSSMSSVLYETGQRLRMASSTLQPETVSSCNTDVDTVARNTAQEDAISNESVEVKIQTSENDKKSA